MFRTRRVLDEISATLTEMRGELAEMRGESAEGFRQLLDTSGQTLGAIHNLQQVNREILLELRDHRTILGRIDHGVQANTEGLMHVLDELRNGRGGAGTAPAG